MEAIKFLGKSNVVVRINKILKGERIGNYAIRTKVFTSDVILLLRLDSAYLSDGKVLILEYFDGVQRDSIYVPITFKMANVRGKKANELKDKYLDFRLLNLSNELGTSAISRIGSDPEIFAEDKDGQLIPSFLFLGSKKTPTKAPNVMHGYNNCYWDGYQGEFDTTASDCLGWHSDSIQNGLKGVHQALKKFDKDAKLSIRTTFDIPRSRLDTDADEHVQFGCMPSKNAYGMSGIKKDGREVSFRSAGGHIHLGLYNECKKEDTIIKGVKAMDAILGVSCVSLFAKYDDPRRRQMYGLAGEYRTPAHGVEYRVLSNAWLCHPMIMNLVMDLSRRAFSFGIKGYMQYWKGEEKEIIRIINECDVKAAQAMMLANASVIKACFRASYNQEIGIADMCFDIMMDGIDSVVADPTNIASNWTLDGTWITHCDGLDKNIRGKQGVSQRRVKDKAYKVS